jgi:hypothetical protein
MRIATTQLEDVVRPFALKNLLPSPTQLPQKAPEGFTDAALGGSGGTSVTYTTDSAGFSFENEEDKFKESGRKSTLKRVENEDDPEQFIEFCRADKISLTPKQEANKPKRTSTYDTSGGGGSNKRQLEYEFQYPDEPTCKSPSEPQSGGNC